MSADPISLASPADGAANAKQIWPTNEANGQSSSATSQTGSQGGWPPSDRYKFFKINDEFVAGCAAAFVNTTALFPINKLIFRQMAGGHKTLTAADQMKEEGKYRSRYIR